MPDGTFAIFLLYFRRCPLALAGAACRAVKPQGTLDHVLDATGAPVEDEDVGVQIPGA